MFSWICPKCGTEVPPAYNECPRCSAAAAADPAQTQAPAQPEVRPAAPLPSPVPPRPARERRPLSPALVAILAAASIVALLAILYMFVLPSRSGSTTASNVALQNPGPAGSSQSAHPLAKHLEIAGIRITHSDQTAKITFLVVNHSAADLPDLKMDLALRPTSGGNPVFEFPVALSSIGPYESREVTSTLKTNLKPYEIPDWQVLRPEFRLTSAQ